MDGDGDSLKACQNCKLDFRIAPEDFAWLERFQVPSPTWCPPCRFQRRILFRNEGKLFRTVSGLSGKNFLSLYPPESGVVVYTDEEWRSDAWDPKSYGREVDFSRPFLAQVYELSKVVPKLGSLAVNRVNSEYSGNAEDLKNCYLCFNSNHLEDCAYCHGTDFSNNCIDDSHIQKCERCYGSFWLTNSYRTHFSVQCDDCTDVWFSKDCRGCSSCFGCANLRLQKYCIFNVQYSREEYEKKIQEMQLDTWHGLQRAKVAAEKFWKENPCKYIQGVQNDNVQGEYITHSKNVQKGYIIRECQDLRYVQYSQVPSSKDCMDCSIAGSNATLMYESSICGWGAADMKFCVECWLEVRALEYCMNCYASSDLFGCTGMKNSQYCILNKQYTKEQYEELVPKIKKHMDDMPYIDSQGRVYKYGEFFPPQFSPLAYQHTIAPEHFPLTKEQAQAFGAKWQEPNPNEYQTTITADTLPDAVEDAKNDILKEIIQCSDCKRAYRIIPQELQFLQQMNLPLPRMCPDCRRTERLKYRNKSKLYERHCGCAGAKSANGLYANSAEHFHAAGACPNEFETSYAPERPEIVYCEQCYNTEVT